MQLFNYRFDSTLFTIGVFDGVHLGHQYLINKLKEKAKQEKLFSGIITFDPPPYIVTDPTSNELQLTDTATKITMLKEFDVDLIVVIAFSNRFRLIEARDFITFLKSNLNMAGILVGNDFIFGRNGEGNVSLLKSLGEQMSFRVYDVEPLTLTKGKISSTCIRRALEQGDIEEVEKYLGRKYSVHGKVVHGDKRGRALGFPTANLFIDGKFAVPCSGVYMTRTTVDLNTYLSATNIGYHPTFKTNKRTIENYLIDYKGNLYGKTIELTFVRKLRDEIEFTSSDQLIKQMKNDLERIKYLNSMKI
jgi:riboflavin kinase/FMN adenylyltransferase